MYYVGGTSDVRWRTREHETLGFTHAMFRDGRARGRGIATAAGGTGHDKWGWEFWREVRTAYGTNTPLTVFPTMSATRPMLGVFPRRRIARGRGCWEEQDRQIRG